MCAQNINRSGCVEPLNPPAPWLGGKSKLASLIVSRIEAIPHDIYCEPFVGMGGVFFRRRTCPRVEVINDYSRDVTTFFRVLQRHENALIEEMLRWRISGRVEFDRLRSLDPDHLTDLGRAARFYYLQRLAFGGKIGGAFGITRGGLGSFNIIGQRRVLNKIHRRMSGVLIECLSYEDFITRYDRPEVLFYLDPPYFNGENDYGKGMFARKDFAKLAELLAVIKGRFLLSINDTPEIRTIFDGFHFEEVITKYSIGHKADRSADIHELIISDGPKDGDGLSRQDTLF